MGQFKPMVKMETTEPSVELKLKKGGSVAHKKMKSDSSSGHKPMKKMMDGGVMGALASQPALVGGPSGPVAPVARPAKPSMAARRMAMMKGLKKRPFKEGGESVAETKAEMKKINKVESELKSHEGKSASKAHKGLKKGGKACYAKGGSVANEETYGSYKTTEVHQAKSDKTSGKTGEVKEGNGGGYKTGGVVLGNGGGYKTGGVALGNAGGYKKGGKAVGGPMFGKKFTTPTTEKSPAPNTKPIGQIISDVANKVKGVGLKKGGSSKKAFASGGSVNDEGKATSMPQGNKRPSSPVSISKLSGTFKKGGNVSSKKLQNAFMNENAPALKASKADSNEVYSVYGGKKKPKHFVGGGMAEDDTTGYKIPMSAPEGNVSDLAYQSVKQAEKAGKKTMIDKPTKSSEKRYPSGLTDSDIDKLLNSKEFRKGASHFSDYKTGGKAKK
jgi:hypothetical protein